jgi:methionyl-tRNA synthetase
MLKALDLPIPHRILAHGWWTMQGAKVSKSLGNIVDPLEIIAKYGADCFRYFLLHEVTLGSDGAYSEEGLRERFEKDLANDLGNLVHRAFGMLEKYFQEKIPSSVDPSRVENHLRGEAMMLASSMDECMERLDPRSALEVLWVFIRHANKFIEDSKPWVLAKDPARKDSLAAAMYTLFESLRFIGILLSPFRPETSARICQELNLPAEFSRKDVQTWGRLSPGADVGKSEPLFPKKEEDPS